MLEVPVPRSKRQPVLCSRSFLGTMWHDSRRGSMLDECLLGTLSCMLRRLRFGLCIYGISRFLLSNVRLFLPYYSTLVHWNEREDVCNYVDIECIATHFVPLVVS